MLPKKVKCSGSEQYQPHQSTIKAIMESQQHSRVSIFYLAVVNQPGAARLKLRMAGCLYFEPLRQPHPQREEALLKVQTGSMVNLYNCTSNPCLHHITTPCDIHPKPHHQANTEMQASDSLCPSQLRDTDQSAQSFSLEQMVSRTHLTLFSGSH